MTIYVNLVVACMVWLTHIYHDATFTSIKCYNYCYLTKNVTPSALHVCFFLIE